MYVCLLLIKKGESLSIAKGHYWDNPIQFVYCPLSIPIFWKDLYQGCIKLHISPPGVGGGNYIKLVGKKIKWGRGRKKREGKKEGLKGKGKRKA